MQAKDYVAANRAAWEEAVPIHRKHNHDRLLQRVQAPGFSCLNPIETAMLERIGVAGKDVAQLCCNNGRELLSVKNLGARRCVGFDQADGFIDQARELAAAGAIDCDFVSTDVHGIPASFDASFDLVTITIGVLSWMPDLRALFAVPTRLLRSGGRLFIYEQHPILGMIEPATADDPVAWDHSYFKDTPFVDRDGLDYYGGATYDSKPMYSFPQKMSDILMAAVTNGLTLEHFEERPDHISNSHWHVERHGPRLPMSYTLVVRKPG